MEVVRYRCDAVVCQVLTGSAWRNILTGGPWTNYIKGPIPHFEFTEEFIIIKVLTKITIKHITMMECEVKSNFIKIVCLLNYCNFNYCKYTKMDIGLRQHANINIKYTKIGPGLGPPRPRRPLAFVQPCPMGVTPLLTGQDHEGT